MGNDEIRSRSHDLLDMLAKALKFKTYKEALQYLHNALLNNETISVISLTSKDFYASITPELAGEFLFECVLNGDILADGS